MNDDKIDKDKHQHRKPTVIDRLMVESSEKLEREWIAQQRKKKKDT